MAYTTINKSSDYFNTKLYTGNGSTNAQTGVGFQPDWVWLKGRSNTGSNKLMDAVRGSSSSLCSNNNNAAEGADYFSSFDSDGFTVATTSNDINANGQTYVGWNWKAGTTGSGTTGGSGTGKAYSYSVNTTSGFSIVTYTGNGSAGHTIPHHLGVAPKFIIVKSYSDNYNWTVYYGDPTDYLVLNATDATTDSNEVWNDTAPSSTVFTVGNRNSTNQNTATFVAYCFANVTGYCNIGSYTGNQNANGPFIYTGFKPAFILSKKIDGASDWYIFDSKREGYNIDNDTLLANQTNAESTTDYLDIFSNGYKVRTTDGDLNTNNGTYMYMAFAEAPFVGSNNQPATAR